ncbi:MAG: hypothetical protein HUJ54_13155 [Erysipelotrichaceae bacterium]|nr:hypothetical protein [Erysipelotrichaceae bacterium]MCF0260800.1 hypothetical protein [Erysipelotrichaceae bacterium]
MTGQGEKENTVSQTAEITVSDRHLHEECGVFGIYSKGRTDAAWMTYYGLYALQHRGQEGAGITLNDNGIFRSRKGKGLVNEVFKDAVLNELGQGNMVVGHVPHGTTSGSSDSNIQPILVNHFKGSMALCHNGNLINAYELRRELENGGSIFHTTTDSEAIAFMIVKERLRTASIEEAESRAMDSIDGAYSLVIGSPSKLIATRDPYGFRPLCMGKLSDGSVIFASESCALDAVGASFVQDLHPGEIVAADRNGVRSVFQEVCRSIYCFYFWSCAFIQASRISSGSCSGIMACTRVSSPSSMDLE